MFINIEFLCNFQEFISAQPVQSSKMSVSLIFILYSYTPIRKQYLWGGGFPNIMMSCDSIIICFPDKTIFILLGCFTQFLQIRGLAKYDQSTCKEVSSFPFGHIYGSRSTFSKGNHHECRSVVDPVAQ